MRTNNAFGGVHFISQVSYFLIYPGIKIPGIIPYQKKYKILSNFQNIMKSSLEKPQ